MRATILLPILSLSFGVLANPPACLLGVVGQQDSPHDLSAICGDDVQDVQAALDKNCNKDSKSAAQEALISTCSAAGSSVAAYTPTSTPSDSSATGTGSSSDPSNTASTFASGTSGAASASGTGSSGDSGAASVAIAGSFVMGAAAVAGLAIAL